MTVSLATLITLFTVGLVQSLSPCVLNRVITLSVLTSSAKRPWVVVVFFTVGVILAYEAFLIFAPFVVFAYAHLSVLYAVAAGVFVAGAVLAFRGTGEHVHRQTSPSRGGVFLLGASTVLQMQPCCMPVVFGIVAASSYLGLVAAALLFAAYAAGHAVPLLIAGGGSVRFRGIIERLGAHRAMAYVNAGLLLFMAAYFAVQV